MNYHITEIFNSIEGEGRRAGQTATFIRLTGCNLRCTYCDTVYSYENGAITSLGEIIETYKKAGIPRVTLTGGEPLAHQGVETLIQTLLEQGAEINIETNGSIDISYFEHITTEKLFFTVDYKLPSSGTTDKMYLPNYAKLRRGDVIKFVVGSDEDLTHMIDFVKNLTSSPQIYIGTVFGKYDTKKIVSAMLEYNELKNTTMQIQLHKIIWHPEERGV